jgi:regulator of sirC expression with transglutaminase-like and TPR domain
MMKEEIPEHYENREQIEYINKLLNSLLIHIKFNMDINDYTKQRGYYILEHM